MEMFIFIGILFLLSTGLNAQQTFADAKIDYEYLVQSYHVQGISNHIHTDTTSIPRPDPATAPLTINISMAMYSMADYDAVAGTLDIVGSVQLQWTDSTSTLMNIDWSSTQLTSMMLDYRKVWTPVVVLINSANSVQRIGDAAYKVRHVKASGLTTWNPRVLMTSSCTPDVSYFPFDQQECDFVFTTWFHNSTYLTLSVSSVSEWDLTNFEPNGVWDVGSTRSSSYETGGYYYAKFTVVFNRQATYYVLNVLFPILLLSFLSGLVFLIPPDSGERVGFGITCFLSFVVLLQTMMEFLPEASSPMSLLCYYVIIMMMFSAVLSIVTILVLKVYTKPEDAEIPRLLVHFIEVVKCIKFKRFFFKKKRAAKITPTANGSTSTEKTDGLAEKTTKSVNKDKDIEVLSITSKKADVEHVTGDDDVDTDDDIETVEWSDVGWILDVFFILAFIGTQAFFSLVFLVPLATRY